MKKFLIAALWFCFIIISCITVLSASDTTAVYNSDTNTVVISSKMNETYGSAVTIIISRQEWDDINLESDSTITDVVNTLDNGFILHSVVIPGNFAGGKYYVNLLSENDSAKTYFMLMNPNEIRDLIPLVNTTKSVIELYNLILSNKNKFAVDEDTTAAYLETTAMILYNCKSVRGVYKSADELITDFRASEAASLIKNGKNVASVIKQYQGYLGIDYETDYLELNANARNLLDNLLVKEDYQGDMVGRIYIRYSVYSQVKTSDSWKNLKDVMEKYDEHISPNKVLFNKVKNKDEIYALMYENLGSINNYDLIKSSFYECSKIIYDSENSSGYSGGGSGGGGSSSMGSGALGSINISASVVDSIISGAYFKNFTDIEGHWSEKYINSLYEKNIISGYPDKTFKPEGKITRGEFIKIVVEAFKISGEGDYSFADISEEDWFYPYCCAASINGIIFGNEKGEFLPEAYISRQDAAVIIYRTLMLTGLQSENTAVGFGDADQISNYAKEAVACLSNKGIINGMENGNFKPHDLITRAQVSAIIYRALNEEYQI